MIKALILDMDDTLIKSSPLQKEAFRKVLQNHDADLDQIPEKLENTFYGMKINEIAEIMVDFFSLEITPEKLLQEREGMIQNMMKTVDPMPGFHELIGYIRKSDFKTALVTSSPNVYVDIVLEKFKIRDIFDVIVTGDSVSKGKPDPEIYKLALKKLNLNPEDCVAVEDSTNGILSAKAAGIKVIGVRNKVFDINQDLSDADEIIGSLSEIKELNKAT